MVQGATRRVIVVKSPGGGFEQAVFFVRDTDASCLKSADELLVEACTIAERYVKRRKQAQRWYARFLPYLTAAGGAALVALLWLAAG